ncbi:MAG: 5' nucleotidase, NT5C type [Chloroflexota bacterium]
MILGVDVDNTIVCYDELFQRAALERGLIPPWLTGTKPAVRDWLRAQGREDAWTELQGWVYGPGLEYAAPFPGVVDALRAFAATDVQVCVISHKTRYPYVGERFDLHASARAWLERMLPGLGAERVFLESTKERKLARIGTLGCDPFIDDLPEFLAEPNFPPNTRRILFDPNRQFGDTHIERICSWGELRQLIVALMVPA